MTDATINVHLDDDRKRFVIEANGEEAGFAAFKEDGKVRVFNHTVIFEDFQGQGLSKPLIKAALDESIADGFKLEAACSAVEHFVEKNPVYAEHAV